MSSWLTERVPTVPAARFTALSAYAEAVLRVVAPYALERPCQLDLAHIVDFELPKFGIRVYPGAPEKMGGRHAYTDVDDNGGIQIVLERDLYAAIFDGGKSEAFARSTLAHEIGHALLHMGYLQRCDASPARELLLAREVRRDIPAYIDPEWQAWAFAGCFLAHPRTLRTLSEFARNPWSVSAIYGINSVFARKHLERIQRLAGGL